MAHWKEVNGEMVRVKGVRGHAARYPEIASLVGQQFARLTVVKHIIKNGRRTAVVVCKCECGNPEPVIVNQSQLKSKNTKSCGCLMRASREEQRAAAMQYGSRHKRPPKITDREWDRGALVNGKWMTPEQIAAKEAEDKRILEEDERKRWAQEQLDQFD